MNRTRLLAACLLVPACAVSLSAWAAQEKKVSPADKPVAAKSEAPVPQTRPVADGVKPEPPKATEAARGETLRFNVNWPSGLSLGEGEISAVSTPEGWDFRFRVDAAFPAFPIAESAESRAGKDLCSLELKKQATRGKRRIAETTVFDAATLLAVRTTSNGGGKTEIRINACARDALTFVWYVRRELAAGRVPQSQPVFYGAAYQTRIQYAGTQKILSGSEYVEADKLTAFIRGPVAEQTIDLFFARDAARTPLQVQIPVAVGRFTVEFDR